MKHSTLFAFQNPFAVCLSFLVGLATAFAAPRSDQGVEGVTLKDKVMMLVQDGQLVPMDTSITLPHDINVSTNGTFKVNQGKGRRLQEGQVLDTEGMLLSPNGAIEPVLDHIEMKNGRVLISKDGEAQALDKEWVFPDNSGISTDGWWRMADGSMKRLIDGQILTLNGQIVPAKDTVSLQEGNVVVQKDGSLLKISPNQSIVMNDGTKVLGSGTVLFADGKAVRLTEGEIVTLQGVALHRR
jgi:D-lyxose ketol-isomerase